MKAWWRRVLGVPLAAALLSAAAPERGGPDHWVGAWASAQQEPEPHNALPAGALEDATLRQLVRVTLPGKRVRVRVSNVFGKGPLTVRGVNVALAASPSSSRIMAGTNRAATFAGAREIVIPAGAEYVSDPVSLQVGALATLAISMHIAAHPAVQTSHPGSRATSYVARGDQLDAPDLVGATSVDHWYQLSGVDVAPAAGRAAIAILGDSITDGFGVKPNTNSRWPDFLAERLAANRRTQRLAVLNLGTGGNRLLQDGLGPNAVARFERDVLGRSGVQTLIILTGVNDLGGLTRDKPATPAEHEALVRRMIAAFAQITARAREHGIRVIGGTILPFGGSAYYHPTAANEADRQAVNAWIRTPGNMDAVIDFDAIMRDPKAPDRLAPQYDGGDGLHPSVVGYKAMAAAIPLSLFAR